VQQFLEIEHKFIVAADFDNAAFRDKILALKPTGRSNVAVVDTYYTLTTDRGYIFRHRLDRELQQLTVKSFGGSTEARLEVNLDLDLGQGNQEERVAAFLQPFAAVRAGRIDKDVEAFYFTDCEVVYYRARSDSKAVACVEFEAKGYSDRAAASRTLSYYENLLGFSATPRAEQSLFDLLLRP